MRGKAPFAIYSHVNVEIFSHIRPKALTTATFHGNGRSENPAAFVNVDLVLTTYSTLMYDYRKAGVLQKMVWFRVVLDEGKLQSKCSMTKD